MIEQFKQYITLTTNTLKGIFWFLLETGHAVKMLGGLLLASDINALMTAPLGFPAHFLMARYSCGGPVVGISWFWHPPRPISRLMESQASVTPRDPWQGDTCVSLWISYVTFGTHTSPDHTELRECNGVQFHLWGPLWTLWRTLTHHSSSEKALTCSFHPLLTPMPRRPQPSSTVPAWV